MQTLGTIDYFTNSSTQTDAANGGKLHHSMIIVPKISHFAWLLARFVCHSLYDQKPCKLKLKLHQTHDSGCEYAIHVLTITKIYCMYEHVFL